MEMNMEISSVSKMTWATYRGLVVTALCLVGCGGSSGGSGGDGSGNAWSVKQLTTNGDLVSCVNYTNSKVTAAQAMQMVQGGPVSADPCPTASNMIGVCTGVDQGGNDFEQVFYN